MQRRIQFFIAIFTILGMFMLQSQLPPAHAIGSTEPGVNSEIGTAASFGSSTESIQLAAAGTQYRQWCLYGVYPFYDVISSSFLYNQLIKVHHTSTIPDIVGYSFNKNGPFEAELYVPIQLDGYGAGRSETFYIKALKIGHTVAQACAPGIGCFTNPGPFDLTVVGVPKVSLVDSSLDDNPNAGGGVRIFPEKTNPSDGDNHDTLTIQAETSPDATVFFRSFDLDDPSTDDAPVDSNGSAGNDNRGTPKSGTLSSKEVKADSAGKATVDFTVTKHPGDNFIIAAGCSTGYLDSVYVDGLSLKDYQGDTLPTSEAVITKMVTVWRRIHIEVDRMDKVTGNVVEGIVARARDSKGKTILTLDQLTINGNPITALESDKGPKGRFENGRIILSSAGVVWGDFLVEGNGRTSVTLQSSVGPDPNAAVGKAVKLVDDDDYNNDEPLFPDGDEGEALIAPPIVLSLVQDSDDPSQNLFAPAYIRPVYDEAGVTNDRDQLPFVLNLPDDAIDAQAALGRDSAANESDDYWVIYLQLAYQSDEARDADPENERNNVKAATRVIQIKDDATSAADVPVGGDVSMIFLETMQDLLRGMDLTVPHEIGHQFGLQGHAAGFGVMSTGEQATDEFVPRHLNILRWRVKSPGQP